MASSEGKWDRSVSSAGRLECRTVQEDRGVPAVGLAERGVGPEDRLSSGLKGWSTLPTSWSHLYCVE